MRAVNLIPHEQRSGASVGAGRSQGAAYAVLALAAGLAVLAVLYGSARHEVASRTAQAASITAQAQQAQAKAEQLAPYTSFIATREQRTQAVDTLIDSRFDWAHVFHEFGRVLPARASLGSLDGTIVSGSATASTAATSASPSSSVASAAAVTSATPPGSMPTFTLTGCATSEPAVAQTLERLRLIDGVSEVTLQSAGSGSSSGGAGCPGHDPSFSATVTFDPMPSTAAVAAATKTVSDSTSVASAAASTGSPR